MISLQPRVILRISEAQVHLFIYRSKTPLDMLYMQLTLHGSISELICLFASVKLLNY